LPQQKNIPRQEKSSEQAGGNTDEHYKPTEEIDADVQNPNLLLSSDHEYTYPFESPSWGGMVVYLNTIIKWYGDLSPVRAPPGLYFGNPQKNTMGWIKVNKLKNLMQKRNVDVEIVDLSSILGSTKYKKELFLIQGYARRGKKMKKDKHGVPEPVPMWRAKKSKKEDDHFFEHTILLEPGVGR
jgi:hypothetical protein